MNNNDDLLNEKISFTNYLKTEKLLKARLGKEGLLEYLVNTSYSETSYALEHENNQLEIGERKSSEILNEEISKIVNENRQFALQKVSRFPIFVLSEAPDNETAEKALSRTLDEQKVWTFANNEHRERVKLIANYAKTLATVKLSLSSEVVSRTYVESSRTAGELFDHIKDEFEINRYC
jgi:hypothetical protein